MYCRGGRGNPVVCICRTPITLAGLSRATMKGEDPELSELIVPPENRIRGEGKRDPVVVSKGFSNSLFVEMLLIPTINGWKSRS